MTSKFIIDNYKPCSVLDVSGGKGVLSYLLNQAGFDCTVVDPLYQTLPNKFRKDCYDKSKGRYLLNSEEIKYLKYIKDIFRPEMVKDFDLIVGLHAHGCMYHILEQCKILDKSFILIPCCNVSEPIYKPKNINWNVFIKDIAESIFKENLKVVNLDFIGNNLTIYNTKQK